MKVFLSVTSFKRSYGGPARSVSRLAEALVEMGVEIGAWAPDGSAIDTPYLGPDTRVRRLVGGVAEALAEFGAVDIIHDNGIWMPHNHKLATLAESRQVPRVVSTRGMVEPWALHHKWWKKRLAWFLYQKDDLRAAAAVHATASSELVQLKHLGFAAPVYVVPNGVDLPELPEVRASGDDSVRTALFMGRVHPVKGLPLLVEAWRMVRPVGWRLRLVGPDEAGHRAEVESLVARAGLSGEWTFDGELEGPAKHEAFAAASLLVLPTHTESFGMVVAEALAHGVPVITTRGAPWERLPLEGCGWWTGISAAGLAGALAEAVQLAPDELREMGARGRRWMKRDFSWSFVGAGILRMYESVLASHGVVSRHKGLWR
jgi:glycosyltransferase involved in cell wall biosynthesis